MEAEKTTKAQRTKKNVLETAMALMGEQGYYNTTIRDICDRAGVSIGTFYTYFPSKRDIFADIFGRADEIFEKDVATQVTPSAKRSWTTSATTPGSTWTAE